MAATHEEKLASLKKAVDDAQGKLDALVKMIPVVQVNLKSAETALRQAQLNLIVGKGSQGQVDSADAALIKAQNDAQALGPAISNATEVFNAAKTAYTNEANISTDQLVSQQQQETTAAENVSISNAKTTSTRNVILISVGAVVLIAFMILLFRK